MIYVYVILTELRLSKHQTGEEHKQTLATSDDYDPKRLLKHILRYIINDTSTIQHAMMYTIVNNYETTYK